MNRPLWIWAVTIICSLMALLSAWHGVEGLRTAVDPHGAYARMEARMQSMAQRFGAPPQAIDEMKRPLEQLRSQLTNPKARLWALVSSVASLIIAAGLLAGVIRLMAFHTAGVTLIRAALLFQIALVALGIVYALSMGPQFSAPGMDAGMQTAAVAISSGIVAAIYAVPLLIMWCADKSILD